METWPLLPPGEGIYRIGSGSAQISGHEQVRRVVATAGDVVDITEEGLMINGASAAGARDL